MKNKQRINKTLILFLLFLPIFCLAYIPSYPMMLSHLARSRGQGAYRIDQEVIFQGNNDLVSLVETWWIAGGSRMRLRVKAKEKQFQPFHLQFVYKNGKKMFRNEKNQIRSRTIPFHHIEKVFHLRNKKKLASLFHRWKMAPMPDFDSLEGNNNQKSFIRLERKGGVIQYRIGKKKAHLQIEQDEFVIRAWEWASGVQVFAWDYNLYPKNLFFPSKRKLKQASSVIFIQLKDVQSLKLRDQWFTRRHLTEKNQLPSNISSADQERIRVFYQKFR